MAAIIWLHEPLPFVPATCIVLNFSCGLPSHLQIFFVFTRSVLIAAAPILLNMGNRLNRYSIVSVYVICLWIKRRKLALQPEIELKRAGRFITAGVEFYLFGFSYCDSFQVWIGSCGTSWLVFSGDNIS